MFFLSIFYRLQASHLIFFYPNVTSFSRRLYNTITDTGTLEGFLSLWREWIETDESCLYFFRGTTERCTISAVVSLEMRKIRIYIHPLGGASIDTSEYIN